MRVLRILVRAWRASLFLASTHARYGRGAPHFSKARSSLQVLYYEPHPKNSVQKCHIIVVVVVVVVVAVVVTLTNRRKDSPWSHDRFPEQNTLWSGRIPQGKGIHNMQSTTQYDIPS